MSQQVINIGVRPNDGNGDPLRTAFDKANDNFTQLYTREIFADVIGDYNGDGGTDDGPALTAAIAALGGAGIVRIPAGKRCYIGSNVTIPDGVAIDCGHVPIGTHDGTAMGTLAGALFLSPSATFFLRNGAGFRRTNLLRAGLLFSISSAEVAATFLGTAITLIANTADHILQDMAILGFLVGIQSEDTTTVGGSRQNDRAHFNNINIDCVNGIHIHNAFDIPRFRDVHLWPFVTVTSPVEPGNAQLRRSGTALKLTGTNDWTMISGVFSYGYYRGFEVVDAGSVTFMNCGADHTTGAADGSVGFLLSGAAREIRLVGCQVAGKEFGVYVNSTYANTRISASILGCNIWETVTAAIHVEDGDVQVIGGSLRNTGGAGIGVRTAATAGKVNVCAADFRGFATALANFSSSIQLTHANCSFGLTNPILISNAYVPTLASAGSLIPDGENTAFVVTGTTSIGSISGPQRYAGRSLTLKFSGSLTVITGGNIRLAGAVNFAATDGDTLTLYSDGTNWFETARSVN